MFGLAISPLLNGPYALCSATVPSSKRTSMSRTPLYRIIVAFMPQFIIHVSSRRFSAVALMFGLMIPPFSNSLYSLCSTTIPSSKRTSISAEPPYRIIVASIPQFIILVSPRRGLKFGLAILPFSNALYLLCSTITPSSKRTSISSRLLYRIIVASIPQFIIRVSPSLFVFVAISYPSLFTFVLTPYICQNIPNTYFFHTAKKTPAFCQCLRLTDALPSLV